MTKPAFAICEQQRLRSACASAQSDQHFVVPCLDSIIPLLAIAEISRPKDGFSRDKAHLYLENLVSFRLYLP